MSYCEMDEAFNSPLKKQLDALDNKDQSFFSAQGNLTGGTDINDLDTTTLPSVDMSFDSSFSDTNSYATNKTSSSMLSLKDHSHEYYIRNYINYMYFSGDSKLSKKELNNIHDHIRTCKFCKDETLIRIHGKVETKNNTMIDNYIPSKINSKDILIFIAITIIILFIINFLSRISIRVS